MRFILSNILLLALLFSCTQKEKEPAIFIIPETFKGEVIVIQDFSNGEPKSFKNGKRLYVIPNNGILFSQFELSYGLVSDEYYIKLKDGSLKQIYADYETQNKSDLCICYGVNGALDIDGVEYEFEGFTVCPKDSIKFYAPH